MFKYLVLPVFVPALVNGQAANVRTYQDRKKFAYTGCSTMPCTVRRGNNALMDLDFSVALTTTALRPVVFASALGATIYYPLPDHLQSACNHIGPNQCLLAAGRTTTYNFVFAVNPRYPPITVGVDVNLLNQDNVAVTCFNVDIAVRF